MIIIAGYLVVINLFTIITFWFDKWMARVRGWRIPELGLWLLMCLGGSVGAIIAMELFRHKRQKTSFLLVAWLIVLVQMGLGIAFYNFAIVAS